MRVIFSGGGTGGHIYPILALIKCMKEENVLDDVLFVGTERGLESKLVPAAGIAFRTLEVQGFNRKKVMTNFKTIELFRNATKDAKKIIADFQPDIVVGTGGYVSAAIVYAATKQHIPTIIHEQNSVVGLANKFLAHFVDRITYVFDDAAKQFSEKKKLIKTGNPRSQEVLMQLAPADITRIHLRNGLPTVLIFGGSRGAERINNTTMKALPLLNDKPYQIIFATGQSYYNDVKTRLAHEYVSENIAIVPYVSDMPALLQNITAVISRSGATTIAEITALGVPAILIPSPNVTHNHQMKNAQDLERAGAAIVIPEDDLNVNNFVASIDHILLDSDYAKKMSQASKNLAITDAGSRLIRVMSDLINEHAEKNTKNNTKK